MDIRQALAELGKSIPNEALEFKAYGKSGKQMATSRTINVNVPSVPVPGKDGLVGRMQLTFCVNYLDISDAATHAKRVEDSADKALESLTPEARQKLLEKYL